MEVHPSAHKHGVRDADIAHAVTHFLFAAAVDEELWPPERCLYLGPDRAGNLLEIVVLERDDGEEIAIHAMAMRAKYQHLLPPEGSEHRDG